MSAKIVVVGGYNTDLVSYVRSLPRQGETINSYKYLRGPGGKGSNQAVGAARLGADVTLIAKVGEDDLAQIGFDLWKQEGIHTEYVVRDKEHSTGVASITVDDAGENTIVVAQGANLYLSEDDIDKAEAAIARADVVLTQLAIGGEIAGYALKVARQQTTLTMLNPSPVVPLTQEIMSRATYITPNEGELFALTATQPGGDVNETALQLLSADDQTVIVTLGKQGARFVRQDETFDAPAFNVDVVDTVGAGDAFNAGLAVAFAEEMTLHEAIRFANAAAALATTKPGAADSMPTREEVEVLLNGD